MLGCFRHVQLFVTLLIVACQAPLSMGFSRQEYRSGLLYPPPGDHPDPGIESASLMSPALTDGLFTTNETWGSLTYIHCVCVYLVAQSCPTLCDPMDCRLSGSSVHGILQARNLEWVAVPSSRGSSQSRDQTCIFYVSCIGRQIVYH